MAAIDDPRTLGRTRLSFARRADVDEFIRVLEQYERGEITADQWRTFRLLRGTYGQRQDGVQMLRVKIPQGLLDANQLRTLADVADRWSRGFGHITTRQNMQFHFVPLKDVPAAMGHLEKAGLTTREACGNSVRNVTACPYAGVSRDEVFDITPYSEALTRYFLGHPLSSRLPRKFKIAFEGCREDHVLAAINDIGFYARTRPHPTVPGREQRGFRVMCGGGTSTMARTGALLEEFIPAGEMLNTAEAIVRVYHRLGDYEHKHRNRLKFLIKTIGWDRFVEEYRQELVLHKADGGSPLPFDPDAPPVETAPDWHRPAPPAPVEVAARVEQGEIRGPGITPKVRPGLAAAAAALHEWRQTNVLPQKQAGYAMAVVTIPLGDLTSNQMRVLAELADAYSDGTVRVTPDQDLVFRWVREDDLEALYARISAAGLGLAGANTITDVTSCPGAESCRLAVTQSRGLGSLLGNHLREHPEIAALAPDLHIKISGCPNGCGQHHIAGLGFQGSIRKVGDRAVPQYFVMLGGGVDDTGATFGRIGAKVPARRIPDAVDRLLMLYRDERLEGEPAVSFFRRVETAKVKSVLADLETMTPADARPEDFIDLGETEAFTPEVMDGECAS
ncbi:MAG TPA: nitrite/sulfite reductase [Vicinamibacterales bacterium]